MIRLIISDCDGVLTDGKLYYGTEGEVLKVFNVKDGTAIKALMAQGIKFGIVSGRSSKALARRAEELGLDFCRMGIENKAEVIRELLSKYGLTKAEVLYVGDDVNDCSAREEVNVFCAVADADDTVKNMADIVLQTKGGKGIVKELLKKVL
jgi:3-deoxy-D-manno-octulosonate 8-phosphate phosphatase (KDO 8-P phosphatase)